LEGDQHTKEKAMKTAYYVPRFIPTVNIFEQLLEFVTFESFNALEGGHNLLLQSLFRSVVFLLRPPPPGFHKEPEPDDGVVYLLPILDLLAGTVGEGIIGGGMVSDTTNGCNPS
jgi:hypothetical protein